MKCKQVVASRQKLRVALVLNLKKKAQAERGNHVAGGAANMTKAAAGVPLKERAGYPLVETLADPATWQAQDGKTIVVDFGRVPWLPDDWGQGVKMTKPISRSRDGFGGTYKVWISPEGKVFYHKPVMEEHLGRKLGPRDGFNGQLRLAQLQGKQTDEKTFFNLLSAKERACLPDKEELHFCVISARRTSSAEGLWDIAQVQGQFEVAGIQPVWYVDEESLAEYRKLGLNAVVGGKLTEARNKALDDAAQLNKACVQLSDDISRWEYYEGKQATECTDDAQNAAFHAATCHVVSPVAAARFLLATLRGAAGPEADKSPQLAGVYMLSSCARAMFCDPVQRRHFILGDFFVVGRSSVRFDLEMTLKEDYDFTCQHIATHGSVMRCNRMVVHAKHRTNAGGACTNRDKKGTAEQRNIAILYRKWPRAIRPHVKRPNEVVLQWPADGDATGTKLCAGPGAAGGKGVKKGVQKDLAVKRAPPTGLPWGSLLVRGTANSKLPYIRRRCKAAQGKTVADVLGNLHFRDAQGKRKKYGVADLRYDLERRCLGLAN